MRRSGQKSVATYNSPNSVLSQGFGYALGILSIIAGTATYRATGCYVTSTAATARRSATVTFDAFVPISSGVTVSDGGVDAASLQLGVSRVVSEDSRYGSVSVPSYDSITVYAAIVTIANAEDDSGSAIGTFHSFTLSFV